jgi:aspartyl/asparaginyl-tRNA synthetase
MDALAPGIGEIIGGQPARGAARGARPRAWRSTPSIRGNLHHHGTVPHPDFGLGFEQIVARNVRDAIRSRKTSGSTRY